MKKRPNPATAHTQSRQRGAQTTSHSCALVRGWSTQFIANPWRWPPIWMFLTPLAEVTLLINTLRHAETRLHFCHFPAVFSAGISFLHYFLTTTFLDEIVEYVPTKTISSERLNLSTNYDTWCVLEYCDFTLIIFFICHLVSCGGYYVLSSPYRSGEGVVDAVGKTKVL